MLALGLVPVHSELEDEVLSVAANVVDGAKVLYPVGVAWIGPELIEGRGVGHLETAFCPDC